MSSFFKVRRIRKKTRPRPWSSMQLRLKHQAQPGFKRFIVFTMLFLFLGYGVFVVIARLPFSHIFSFLAGVFGEELEIDEKSRTNILLLGIPGKGHEGEDLTDSIHLISIHHKKRTVSILSIPRDLWIETKEVGANRINHLYALGREKLGEEKGLEMMRFTVSHVFDIPVHYAVLMDMKGFESVIDAMGGIEINVEKTISDPYFPKEGTYDVEHFFIAAGRQMLDGKTALKYARSRGTTSDFDRAKRQQQIMVAVKERAISTGFLTSPSKIRDVWRVTKDHFETNMDLRELITLASLASRFDRSQIFWGSLHDDPTVAGGFLYTPLRELYGGALVLLPASDQWTEVRRYTRFITEMPEWIANGGISIQVLNGAKIAGLARSTKIILQRYGFRVPRFGNAQNQAVKMTMLYIKNKEKVSAADLFKNFFPVEVSESPPEKYLLPPYQSTTDMILELGEDFIPVYDKLDVFRNVVPLEATAQQAASPPLLPQTPPALPQAKVKTIVHP